MKTIRNILIVLCMMLISCNNPETLIRTGIAVANQQCPMDLGEGLSITKIEFTGLYVTYFVKGDYRYYFTQDKDVVESAKSVLITNLRQQELVNKDMKTLLENLRKAKAGIIYHYYSDVDSSVMDVVVEHNEL